ncbi:hypothetical protein LCGC14_3099140, partial [marine sediment metagenome]
MTSGASVRPDNRPQLASDYAIARQDDSQTVRQQRLSQIPARQRAIFRRAWKGRSRKAAIRAFCLECVGNESAEVN